MIIGAYSLFWGFLPFSLEIDQTFIGAILTAIGYSINDKVVIFDRVREFFGLYPKRDKRQLFNDSLNTTLARTINTSLSTLIVLLCIFILGGDSIRSFAFAMILGVVIGTLSSLFIASPIAYNMMKNKRLYNHYYGRLIQSRNRKSLFRIFGRGFLIDYKTNRSYKTFILKMTNYETMPLMILLGPEISPKFREAYSIKSLSLCAHQVKSVAKLNMVIKIMANKCCGGSIVRFLRRLNKAT